MWADFLFQKEILPPRVRDFLSPLSSILCRSWDPLLIRKLGRLRPSSLHLDLVGVWNYIDFRFDVRSFDVKCNINVRMDGVKCNIDVRMEGVKCNIDDRLEDVSVITQWPSCPPVHSLHWIIITTLTEPALPTRHVIPSCTVLYCTVEVSRSRRVTPTSNCLLSTP